MIEKKRLLTGVNILEDLLMLELESKYQGALRNKVEMLIRLVVQDLTVETLTIEKWTWLLRPLLCGQADAEEKIIRVKMYPSLEQFNKSVDAMGTEQYDRIPLGLVGTARQILQTAAAYQVVYNRTDTKTTGTQTEKAIGTHDESFESRLREANEDQTEIDPLQAYFEESQSDCEPSDMTLGSDVTQPSD